MKQSRVLGFICLIFIFIFFSTACGKADKAASTADIKSGGAVNSTSGYSESETDSSEDMDSDNSNSIGAGTDTEKDDTSEMASSDTNAESQNKIIQSYTLNIETKGFDKLISEINSKINSMGGYIESSEIGGNSYSSSENNRNGSMIARIPDEKADLFVEFIKKNSNVIDNQKTTENVTLDYIDTQSRIKALKIEQDRLFAILKKTDKLDNIITLENRLSDIRYELQNYQSQLRTYDNKVEYSTVTLNIQEVERITAVKEKKQTFTERIKSGLGDSMYHIGEGFKNFLVWFIVNLPYLLIWGVVILLVVWIARRYLKKQNAKDEKPGQ